MEEAQPGCSPASQSFKWLAICDALVLALLVRSCEWFGDGECDAVAVS